MTIDVIQSDIDNGVPCSRQGCMLGQTFRRLFPKRFVGAGLRTITLLDETFGWPHDYHLPEIAVQAVYDFNGHKLTGRKVLPFSFELPC